MRRCEPDDQEPGRMRVTGRSFLEVIPKLQTLNQGATGVSIRQLHLRAVAGRGICSCFVLATLTVRKRLCGSVGLLPRRQICANPSLYLTRNFNEDEINDIEEIMGI